MNVSEAFEKRLLRQATPSKAKAQKSLEAAARFLGQSEKSLGAGAYDAALLTAYSSMFHAARAVLFSDGVVEKSHYAVCIYLGERHSDLGKEFVNGFDLYRLLRHSTAYDLDTSIGLDDAEKAFKFAENFLAKVKVYLG